MRTFVKDGEWYLTCKDHTGNKNIITVKFDIDTVFDWYPLSVSYEVRYDERCELFFIAPRDYEHPNKYGINQRRREKATKVASFPKDNFFIEAVKWDNGKIIDTAKAIGLPTLEDKPGRRTIMEGHGRISELYDNPINESMLSRAYENMTEKQWKKFLNGDDEAKSIIVHKFSTVEERIKLKESGYLRTYLNFLRKGAVSGGF